MRLDDVADAEGVDVGAEAAGETAGAALAAEFAGGVGVHGVDIVVFLEGELVVCWVLEGLREVGMGGRVTVGVPLREAHAICRLRTRDHHFLDSEFTRRFDHVVCALYVRHEALVVWHQHIPRVGRKMYHSVRLLHAGFLVLGHVEERREGVEDLAAVGEIGLHGVDIGVVEGYEIEVQDFVALRYQVGDTVAAGFAAAAGENDPFSRCCCGHG